MFKVVMSQKDADWEEYKAPDGDEYLCRIDKLTQAQVKSEKSDNFGKPFWKAVFIVEEGKRTDDKFAGSRIFENFIPLYSTADNDQTGLNKLRSIVRATNVGNVSGRDIEIPELDNGDPDPKPFINRMIVVKFWCVRAGETYRNRKLVEDEFRIVTYYPPAQQRDEDDYVEA